MRTLLSSVVWRYLAIALQFAVVVTIAHRTSLDIAGRYFAIFGFIAVTSMTVGLGIPEGLVRQIPYQRAAMARNEVNRVIIKGAVSSVCISGLLGLTGYFVAYHITNFGGTTLLLATTWWMAYATNFLLAQVLVAEGYPAMGTFSAFSSISIGYVFTLIPVCLLRDDIALTTLLSAANIGAWVATLSSLALAVSRLSWPKSSIVSVPSTPSLNGVIDASAISVRALLRSGFPMMISRFLQASLAWIPVWILIAFVSAEESAIYAAASRLTVAVTSVVAALRFSIRPSIVELDLAGRYRDIAKLNRKCSLISLGPPLLGLAILLIAGERIIPIVLGEEYISVAAVLIVLMFGVMAEAFGGMSDEILKMTGRTYVVLITLVCAVTIQLVASCALAPHGATHVAFATFAAFLVQYSLQLIWLSSKTEIKVIPMSMNLWPKVKG